MCRVVDSDDDLFAEAQRLRRRLEFINTDVSTRHAELEAKLDQLVELITTMGILREELSLSRESARF